MEVNQVQIIKPIIRDPIQNPYKPFTYTLAANKRIRVDYDHSFLRVFSLTGAAASNFSLRWANSADVVNVPGAGIAFDLGFIVPFVELVNESSTSSLTVTVGLGTGIIHDDRVFLSADQNLPVIPGTGDTVSFYNSSIATAGVKLLEVTTDRIQQAHLENIGTSVICLDNTQAAAAAGSGYLLQIGEILDLTIDKFTGPVWAAGQGVAGTINVIEKDWNL